MITAKSLTKAFGPKVAVDNVSFEVKTGEVLGFLGPNGAGKSTTMKMLTGFLPMNSGSITINGHDIAAEPIQAKASIGYLPENAPAYPDSTVEGFLNFIAEAKGLFGDAKREAVEKAIATCQLEKVRRQTIDTLPKGYKHRTCFAQAIISNPPILILDEPTDGLDPNQKHEMRNMIREMGKNKAIIVSTHILEEVEAICTRVIIIDRGKIVFNGTPAELRGRSPEAGTVLVKTKVPFEEFEAAVRTIRQAERIEKRNDVFAVIPSPKGNGLAGEVKALFKSKNWDFDEFYIDKGRLDEVFRTITTTETDNGQAKEAK